MLRGRDLTYPKPFGSSEREDEFKTKPTSDNPRLVGLDRGLLLIHFADGEDFLSIFFGLKSNIWLALIREAGLLPFCSRVYFGCVAGVVASVYNFKRHTQPTKKPRC